MNANDSQMVKAQLQTKLPEFRVGDMVKVAHKVIEGGKQRVAQFSGLVIARSHGQGINATFTVRSTAAGGYGIERIFPLHSPIIESIEPQKRVKVRRAKLYYLRREIDKKRRRFTTTQEYATGAPVVEAEPVAEEVAAKAEPPVAEKEAAKAPAVVPVEK